LNTRREVRLGVELEAGLGARLGSMLIMRNDSFGGVECLGYGGLASCKFHPTSLSPIRELFQYR